MDESRLLAEHPSDQLWELLRCRPEVDAPVKQWTAWLERQAQLWEALADVDPVLAANAHWMVNYLCRTVKDLKEQFEPNDQWPGASSW